VAKICDICGIPHRDELIEVKGKSLTCTSCKSKMDNDMGNCDEEPISSVELKEFENKCSMGDMINFEGI